ncbi:hypothetical protein [Ensifer sp. B1-9]|uniref:hypothetical protein n=1 Tax=Ensifer sp. B1-9 TaxID=3141455 RepID=UPI003D20708D
MKKLAIIALSLATALSSVGPVQAFPSVSPLKAGLSNVEQVTHRHRQWYYDDDDEDGWRYDRRYYDEDDDDYYHHRHHHSDIGAFIGGFAVGAILGGALSAPPRRHYHRHSYSNW